MKLIIAGTGFPEILTLINEINKIEPNKIEILGFIDDNIDNSKRNLYGNPFLGSFENLRKFKDAFIINTISRSMKVRLKSTNRLLELGAKFCNIVHPLCKLPDNSFGVGNIISSGCIFEIGTSLGSHNLFLRNNIIGHDSQISNYSFFGHGCVVNGHTKVGDYCFVGAKVVLGPSINIADKSVIAPSSYIGFDTKENSSYIARPPYIISPTSESSVHDWN